ncbi:MAG TPA: hypothetical protein VHP83_12190 [Aggregatilineaceae bacterium]|nr:hypothetical protein [Aggregatilineaceae bacterium]
MGRKAYPSDLTDEQGEALEAEIPKPLPVVPPATHERREIVNGILRLGVSAA